MKEIDNRIYFEDALLTFRVLGTLYDLHHIEVTKAYRHVRVAGFEVDAVVVAKTPQGKERWVGFELKESDLYKAFNQAKKRRPYFDYFYIIIEWKPHTLVEFLMGMVKNGVDFEGIGFISGSTVTRRYTTILKSKYSARAREQLVNGREIPENQLSLLKFIEEETRWD